MIRTWLRAHGVRFLEVCKDGGPESTVWAYVLLEWKAVGSIMLLRFENGSRDAYHSHAFHCVSWLLSGGLVETRIEFKDGGNRFSTYNYLPSACPILTLRSHLHKVVSVGRSWVFTVRGPWSQTWIERAGDARTEVRLQHGRKQVQS